MTFRIKKILATLALAVALCAGTTASAKDQWKESWMPEGVSSYSKDIDNLFYFVLVLTGVVFIATEGCLIVFVLKYQQNEERKSFYTHGDHKLEMIWTITPAVTLIFIALVQASTWNHIKDSTHFADKAPDANIKDYVHVQMFAEQFSWYFRYPAIVKEDGKNVYKYGVPGTFTTDRVLTVPKGKKVIVEMTSKDVIHSFFLPYMRLKQDVVPGMQIRCWFDAMKTTEEMREDRPKMPLRHPGKMVEKTPGGPKVFDRPLVEMEWDYPIVCAELCGTNHFQMWGRVKVLESDEYDKWLENERTRTVKDGEEEQPIFANYWQVDPATQQRIYGKSPKQDDSSLFNKRTALVFEEHHDGAHGEKKIEHAEEKHDDKKAEK